MTLNRDTDGSGRRQAGEWRRGIDHLAIDPDLSDDFPFRVAPPLASTKQRLKFYPRRILRYVEDEHGVGVRSKTIRWIRFPTEMKGFLGDRAVIGEATVILA